MGLRELKKARTRKAISDVATRLFLERGYHFVTTAEIALAAEVSLGTLFKYFPTKEALVFDEDASLEAQLVAAVASRPAGCAIVDALRIAILDGPYFHAGQDRAYADFAVLVRTTPELTAYMRQMAFRYERSIARAIADTAAGALTEAEALAIAHYVLEAVQIAQRAEQPVDVFNTLIDRLKSGVGF